MDQGGTEDGVGFAGLVTALRAFLDGPLCGDPSDRALSRAAGISPTTIGKWLSGAQFPQDEGKLLAVIHAVTRRAAIRRVIPSGTADLLDEECWRQAYRAEGRRRAGVVSTGVQRARAVRVLAGPPTGWLLGEVSDPGALEVHRLTRSEDAPPELSVYVWREHDDSLARVVRAAAAGRSKIAVLVGGSSTGKTRACWEALGPLRDQEPEWRLWHPLDPSRQDAVLRDLPGVKPRTVVWLNEAQFYLGSADAGLSEQVAAGLRELLRDPDRAPVLVLATLRPGFWASLTGRPADGDADPHAQARELLTGHDITAPAVLTAAQAGQLSQAGNIRPAPATKPADGQVNQLLAGALDLETPLGTLPGLWNLPPRNPNFTGRSAELGHLHVWLAAHPAVTVHALRGTGGVGKTQTVIEYAYRYAADYDLVWWVNAEQPRAIGDQFTSLAAELGLPQLPDSQNTVRAVLRVLRARSRWLLIFDNAESPKETRLLLPGGAGHVLITTRRGGFRALGEVLDLDVLGRPDAVVLLRRRAPALTEAQADHLAARLGDLPLALDQAAAYVDQNGIPPQEYLRLLDTRSADMHERGDPTGHPGNVASVWSVSIDRLQATEPATVQLLELCAWLAPEPIPLDLFTSHSDLLPEPLASAAADPVTFNDVVGALADYSLARRIGGNLIIHRLVQDVTRHRPTAQLTAGAAKPLDTVLALLRADLPGQIWATPASWPRWRALLPSVLAATGHHADAAEEDDAWLLAGAATYLRSQGRYADALSLYQRALQIDETSRGQDDPCVAIDLGHIGRALTAVGRAAEAMPLHQRALQIDEATLGPDNPQVAIDLNYLGRALSAQGRAAEALPLHQRALQIRENALGPDHPDVATDLGYVGVALSALDRAAEALPHLERAQQIDETALGPDHPYIATDLNNLGQALSALGRPTEALPLHQRALQIRENVLGPDHPEVAIDLNNAGRALTALGRTTEALPLHRRALQINESALGPDHPHTLQSRNYIDAQRPLL